MQAEKERERKEERKKERKKSIWWAAIHFLFAGRERKEGRIVCYQLQFSLSLSLSSFIYFYKTKKKRVLNHWRRRRRPPTPSSSFFLTFLLAIVSLWCFISFPRRRKRRGLVCSLVDRGEHYRLSRREPKEERNSQRWCCATVRMSGDDSDYRSFPVHRPAKGQARPSPFSRSSPSSFNINRNQCKPKRTKNLFSSILFL